VAKLLRSISTTCDTRLVIVTGRPAHEVVPLLGMMPFPEIWGTYGLERLYGDGARWSCRSEQAEISEEAAAALADAEVQLDSQGLRERIEIKLAGVAVHWRGLDPSETLKVRTDAYRVLEPFSRRQDLVMAEFEQGVELRLQCASKGNALRSLLNDLDPDVPVAYLGDDATDEDAFRVLNGRGLTVLVRPKHKFSSAQVWLKPPGDLVLFLRDWVEACGGRHR
jgi:trehalose-phosphatase